LIRITREKAESLLNGLSVEETKVLQNKDQIRVIFKLSDDRSLVYQFDTKKRTKTYFLDKLHHMLV
jgi:hypothetical protein